ncbi:MAG: hypothetical protein ABR954_08810 [Dehalococcoidales bacterium]
MNTPDYTPQLIQAILVGSSALLGFTGVLDVQLAKTVKKVWEKWFVGLFSSIIVVSFITCISYTITWFGSSFLDSASSKSAVIPINASFVIQSICFLILFLEYIGSSFYDTRR